MYRRASTEINEQLVFALHQTMAFFNKELDAKATQIWLSSLSDVPADDVLWALEEACAKLKHAPRPAHLRELLEDRSESNQSRYQGPERLPEPTRNVAPPHVASAWRYVISQWGCTAADMFNDHKLDADQIEDAILLCNQQVKQSDEWEAIPPHLWLESVHGKPYPGEHHDGQ